MGLSENFARATPLQRLKELERVKNGGQDLDRLLNLSGQVDILACDKKSIGPIASGISHYARSFALIDVTPSRRPKGLSFEGAPFSAQGIHMASTSTASKRRAKFWGAAATG